ncbi:hypothetical protein [Solemya velum gill symbiont]|uniref:Uncharacterized protein n=1 Tax=Solemya velum gill symbiont TaxID=2340 RepID=A0A0B0H831_SOVGS|nr:hypothetical protein [Solemya velum gill symbiont]KHF25260.1 hypothetical protein JV46_10500 [Solemya velum gill symbiont]OOY34195.1 hypothetical protein BOV88_11415 [Solemya velum gill symbiont]OOY36893.1 hypothetical protein BOV89_10330 [Solemya velum gill symbiont]OOY40055.1 hypothetical protein BOV90_06200 [Solemya velum gill symbiont]OOY43923.1 hypothetical protein BOV92_10035 [Solemya velum gill symbiont]
MNRLLKSFKKITFAMWLIAALLTTTLSLAAWSIQMSATVATMTANAAATAIAHRKALTRAVMKTKAKARLRRAIVAIPIVGIGAASAFEFSEYKEWKEQHPEKNYTDYACEISQLTSEIVDEVLYELPGNLKPSPRFVQERISTCPDRDIVN